MADAAQLTAWLAEAEAAYQKLVTGTAVVSVGYEGHQVQYAKAEAPRLLAHINKLKAQLGQAVKGYRSLGITF